MRDLLDQRLDVGEPSRVVAVEGLERHIRLDGPLMMAMTSPLITTCPQDAGGCILG